MYLGPEGLPVKALWDLSTYHIGTGILWECCLGLGVCQVIAAMLGDVCDQRLEKHAAHSGVVTGAGAGKASGAEGGGSGWYLQLWILSLGCSR